jgi:hypothetical protein
MLVVTAEVVKVQEPLEQHHILPLQAERQTLEVAVAGDQMVMKLNQALVVQV